MSYVSELKTRVLSGYEISGEEALRLCDCDTHEVCAAANEIRKAYCASGFDMCTIINAKSGNCSENCKYCAQSAHYHTSVEEYPLMSQERIVSAAKHCAEQGIGRFSIVTSGKSISDDEVDKICAAVRAIHAACEISVCVSLGLLSENQFARLAKAGVVRVHNNLEASRDYFAKVCTTHTFDDKLAAIRAAQSAGLSVCSGGIFGMGETMASRIDMALSLRELGVKSVPINMLNPIAGTPCEGMPSLSYDELLQIVAIYRFILPQAYIRLAGGRGLMPDKGEGAFNSGANAAITGDMLTTAGISAETDMALIRRIGYEVEKIK